MFRIKVGDEKLFPVTICEDEKIIAEVPMSFGSRDTSFADKMQHKGNVEALESAKKLVIAANRKAQRKADELEIVIAFYDRVCRRADESMKTTGVLEGAHYAALRAELAALREEKLAAQGA